MSLLYGPDTVSGTTARIVASVQHGETLKPSDAIEAAEPTLPSFPRRDDNLPRSRHRPVAVTEGNRTRNLNRSGVRLWTDCSPPKAWSSWAQEMSEWLKEHALKIDPGRAC